ncbi:MAG TPA: c-type cytochrome domain-containing protein, partial [Chthoniobacter sp.]
MKYFLLLGALLLALAGTVTAADENAADGVKLAGKVHEIFEAKCLDCHGPELPRPKGKFGYVLDLKRVADNTDYIVRGDPEKSDLFKMVEDDEMPGEDANVP